MQKFYCDQCRLLYDQKKECKVCGIIAENEITIEVQSQSKKSDS